MKDFVKSKLEIILSIPPLLKILRREIQAQIVYNLDHNH